MNIEKNQLIAKFMINDLAGILKRKGLTMESNPIDPHNLSYMLDLMMEGHLERKDVKLWCMEECDKFNNAVALVQSFIKDITTVETL